ncbi:conserved hypothetical protein [Parvibaculum lavamentivorans DS-1]|uniref:Transmembrane protein n=1 Tax=Parvibaculum lavamentivorans (strain DS-1 / DSM 13023 / NCIMB 13966) TaxID=402881 RepID=A7HW58_PARL1|nr:hypothetical protein [Parvibaculum lavamentivorans]ABS64141.1 conserved hypothetical protein [Parvibaculum lavamentivorans DS-1]
MQERTIKAVAWCDLALTAPFAIPFVAEALISLIHEMDRQAGFGTPVTLFEMGPLSMMFVHIMGVLGVVWAFARLRTPIPALARIDAGARLAVAALIAYAIAQGATPVLWLFIASEITGSMAQFFALRRYQ